MFKDSQGVLQMERVHTFSIPYSKQRWASAVEVLDQDVMATEQERRKGNCHIVFGDRKGSIHLFDARGSSQHEVIIVVVNNLWNVAMELPYIQSWFLF